MTTHLFRRSGRYYVRRRIPADLVEHFGKKEIQQALGTSDSKEAATLCRVAGTKMDVRFLLARAALAALPVRTSYWDDFPIEQVEADEEMREINWDAEEYARDGAYIALKRAVQAVLEDSGMLPQGHRTAHPELPALAAPTPNKSEKLHSMADLVRAWAAARKPAQDTIDSTSRMVSRFEELSGTHAVRAVTKLVLVEFQKKMLAAGHSEGSASKYVRMLSVLFKFAVSQAWIDENPASGVTTRQRTNPKTARLPFDSAALNGIFSGRIYTAGYRSPTGAGEAAFWLPLLGLFTGARIEELAQLSPNDIYQESYRDGAGTERACWVLRITGEGDGQGVKNDGSERRIPVHAELLKRGFIEYAASHAGKSRIFPKLKLDRYGRESTYWSMWWLRHIRKECGVTSSKMVFHSFRHNFKDACREHGITKEVADAIQGHTEGDASGDYGGTYYPLRPLVEAMEKYAVSGLVLPTTV